MPSSLGMSAVAERTYRRGAGRSIGDAASIAFAAWGCNDYCLSLMVTLKSPWWGFEGDTQRVAGRPRRMIVVACFGGFAAKMGNKKCEDTQRISVGQLGKLPQQRVECGERRFLLGERGDVLLRRRQLVVIPVGLAVLLRFDRLVEVCCDHAQIVRQVAIAGCAGPRDGLPDQIDDLRDRAPAGCGCRWRGHGDELLVDRAG